MLPHPRKKRKRMVSLGYDVQAFSVKNVTGFDKATV